MNINDYAHAIKQELTNNFFKPEEGFTVSITSNQKNNNTQLLSINIFNSREKDFFPKFYINEYSEIPPASAAIKIFMQYKSEAASINKEIHSAVKNLSDFDKCKDQVCYKLINTRLNQEYLKDKPNIPVVGDLSVIFYLHLFKGSSIIINKEITEYWGLPQERASEILLKRASDNTKRLKPAMVERAEDILPPYMQDSLIPSDPLNTLFILSSEDGLYGAASMLYDNGVHLSNTLETINKESHQKITGIYILPSSIHEVLLLADTKHMDPRVLQSMVQEVNQYHVKPEEVLSNQVFHYDPEHGLTLAKGISPVMDHTCQDITR